MAQRLLTGNTLTRNIKGRTMVRGGADGRNTRLQLHAVFLRQGLEGHITLIVVHRQHTIEILILMIAKELIGSKGAECLNTLLFHRLDGRSDDILLLCALLWIQGQHSQTGVGDAEITLQTLEKQLSLLRNLFNTQSLGHILDGQMVGHQTNTHQITQHHEQRLILSRRVGIRLYRSQHQHVV